MCIRDSVSIAQPNLPFLLLDLEHPALVHERVEELLVVRHEHESAGAMTQHVLQGLDRAYIQMVRRFVHDDEARRREQATRDHELAHLSRAQLLACLLYTSRCV